MSGSKASWKQFHTRIFGDSAPVTADSLGAWFLLDFPFRYLGSACVLEDSILHPTSSMSGSIRFQNHKNLQKKKQKDGIMSLIIKYLNDKIDHEKLMSKLNLGLHDTA